PISALHVFSYSARPEAAAYRMTNAYAPAEKEERSRRLHRLSDAKKAAFYERFAGQTAAVLWESERLGDEMLGYTENYLRVAAPYDATKINTLETVRLDTSYLHPDKDRIMTVQTPSPCK
ncbi:MAG: hypothetical protein K2F84_00445, partial [Bacteroidales bacterium]|nr:hypothetical protein [Bacteroidales bacterium]